MDEPVRWVTKAEAAEELEVSLSTLDRMIRRGEAEVRREGRRVYVRMEGEYVSDEELLRRAAARERELERTVRQLERNLSEAERRASKIEQERDEAKEAVSAGRLERHQLQEEHRKEVAAHRGTKDVLNFARVTAFALLVLLIGSVLLWWFVLR